MKQLPSAQPGSFESKFFLWLLVAVSLAFLWVLSPFYGAVFWGAVFAIVFAPLHARLLKTMPLRHTLAAVLALLFILLLVIFPLSLVSALLVQEAGLVFQRMQSGEMSFSLYFQQIYDALPIWVSGLLTRFGLTDMGVVQERITRSLTQGSQFFATQALSIGQNTFEFLVSFFIMLYLLFFFLRDGSALGRRMTDMLPLQEKRDAYVNFAAIILAYVLSIVILGFFGKLLWNNVIVDLFSFAKPAKSFWQLIGLMVFVSLLLP